MGRPLPHVGGAPRAGTHALTRCGASRCSTAPPARWTTRPGARSGCTRPRGTRLGWTRCRAHAPTRPPPAQACRPRDGAAARRAGDRVVVPEHVRDQALALVLQARGRGPTRAAPAPGRPMRPRRDASWRAGRAATTTWRSARSCCTRRPRRAASRRRRSRSISRRTCWRTYSSRATSREARRPRSPALEDGLGASTCGRTRCALCVHLLQHTLQRMRTHRAPRCANRASSGGLLGPCKAQAARARRRRPVLADRHLALVLQPRGAVGRADLAHVRRHVPARRRHRRAADRVRAVAAGLRAPRAPPARARSASRQPASLAQCSVAALDRSSCLCQRRLAHGAAARAHAQVLGNNPNYVSYVPACGVATRASALHHRYSTDFPVGTLEVSFRAVRWALTRVRHLQPSAERQRRSACTRNAQGAHRAAARQPDCQPLRTCSGKPGEVQLNACQNDPPTNGIVLEGAMVGGPNHEQFTLPTPSWDPGHCSCAAHPIRPRILRPPWQSTCSSLQLAAQPC